MVTLVVMVMEDRHLDSDLPPHSKSYQNIKVQYTPSFNL